MTHYVAIYLDYHIRMDMTSVSDESRWKIIQPDHDAKEEFNDILFNYEKLSRESHSAASYTEFNANILLAAQETAMRKKTDNQGWFHHSENILLPIIS